MKIKGFRKKIIGAGVLLAGVLFICFYVWNRDSVLKGTNNVPAEPNGQESVQNVPGAPDGQESAQDDVQIPLADIDMQYQIWERRYGENNRIPMEILRDLQRYVARGECAEALSAYRQEELQCTAKELKEVCPEYRTLVDQYLNRRYRKTRFEANKIYRLETADGKRCFLLFFWRIDTDNSFLYPMLLKEGEEGWEIIQGDTGYGGVSDYEVFAGEQAGQKVYYLLKAYDMEGSSAWLRLARFSETFSRYWWDWDIRLIETGVRPEYLFQETESELTAQVKEYVEDNLWFLAWMQQNGKPIWGDEDAQTHGEMRGYFGGAGAEVEQKWLIDFDGDSVTFQMTKSKDESLVLEAYTQEGKSGGELLLSCRICYILEAGIGRYTPAYFEAFDFNGLTFRYRNTEDIWLRDEVQERVREEQQQRNIAPWQGEPPFSEEIYRLLREEARTGLYGEENSLLESYRLDLTEDMEIFMQRAAETDGSKDFMRHYRNGEGECKWVYRWLEEDGSENFLSCINYNYAKDSIQWWKTGEGGLEEYDYVTENEHPSQMICCGGQLYYMCEAAPEYWGGEVYVKIVEIGDSENWQSYVFSIRTGASEDPEIACIPLYEEEGLSSKVKDYVQEWYEDIGEACEGGFSGTDEGKELTAEENRMLNSLSDGNKNPYANIRYFACDVDNDGTVEYGYAHCGGYPGVTFYEKENGEFRVISLEEVIPDLNGAAGSLAATAILRQLWCEELGDTTYLFTVEELAYSPDYILRIRVLRDDYVEDKAIYLLKADMEESCWEWVLEITPSAEEGVG